MDELAKQVTDVLSKRQMDMEEMRRDGEFQPLSYWANQGYDTERIKANTPHAAVLLSSIGPML